MALKLFNKTISDQTSTSVNLFSKVLNTVTVPINSIGLLSI